MRSLFAFSIGLLVSLPLPAAELSQTEIISSRDQSPQPIRYLAPQTPEQPVPLLVLLHSWSGDYRQTGFVEVCQTECLARGWALLHPQFRGPNTRPEAGGSDLAVQDVLDAVDWMSNQTRIDPRRIYLIGASGGGHMTLLLAGRHPERWAAASAWVPISDLAAWHAESVVRKQRYQQDLEKVCGGVPGSSTEVDEQYRLRSPLTWLEHAKGLPIDIAAGIHDGHTGSVPVSHSLRAFNVLATTNDRPDAVFSPEQITTMVASESIPADLRYTGESPATRQHKILLQRTAGPARLTLFEGGHEGDMPTSIDWLAQHTR